jgi:hypothetical protein
LEKVLGSLTELNERLERATRKERRARADSEAAARERQRRASRIALDRNQRRYSACQQLFDDALDGWNVRAPAPAADETYGAYLRRLCRLSKAYIAADDALGKVVFSSLPDDSLHVYAGLLLDAVKRAQTRPDTVAAGELRELTQRDPNGMVIKTFVGARCFTDDFTTVRGKAKIVNPDVIGLRGQKRNFGGLWS